MIDMMKMQKTILSFSLIQNMSTRDHKKRLKVLVLFKRTSYKLSRMTMTYNKIQTRMQEITNSAVIWLL
jgi:hypothetical protein